MKTDISLTFVILTYNHSGFVLEHLESIAHLVKKYDQIEKHDLIVSDDASADSTVVEISDWLIENRKLFREVTTFFANDNVGTCKSFLRATENIKTKYVKVTGGDDLFSDEDIFSELRRWRHADIIGSQPLILINGVLHRFHRFNLIYALANSVYSGKPFREQLVGHGAIFTPGLIYSSALISDKRVRNFVSKFSLVEDFPSWIAISEFFPAVKYCLSPANLVYYRRTPGSAYLIAGSRVFSDQLGCRKYLLATEVLPFSRWLIRNRIWLMTSSSSSLKSILDFGRLVFAVRLLFHLPSVFNNGRLLFVDLGNHVRHYGRIKDRVAGLKRIDS